MGSLLETLYVETLYVEINSVKLFSDRLVNRSIRDLLRPVHRTSKAVLVQSQFWSNNECIERRVPFSSLPFLATGHFSEVGQ